uniref:Putative secreted protein n=1 Tax=Anopheles triannulatus TaxID=58253 RepID=A0A2M4AUS9_9DIPT
MIGKRLDVLQLLLPVLLLLTACLIVIVTDASPVPDDSNDVAAWETNGSPTDGPTPAPVTSPDHDARCCLGAIKPIVLTAKPRYKYVVVPPLSIT